MMERSHRAAAVVISHESVCNVSSKQYFGILTRVSPIRVFSMKLMLGLVFPVLVASLSSGQVLSRRPKTPARPIPPVPPAAASVTVPLTIPAGTSLKIALDQEVRVRHVGQAIRGRIIEPVYVFDKLVIPAGTKVTGSISSIISTSEKMRIMAAMNADFSPAREVRITCDELQFADGRRVPIRTEVLPGAGGALQLVAADTKKPTMTEAARSAFSRRIAETKKQVHDEWNLAKAQLHEPGKKRRLERLAIAQLPYRPQYLEAGTVFNAELQQPLDFGQETLAASSLLGIGAPLAAGSVLHAELLTPLSSATSRRGDAVSAVITEPVFTANRLLLPEGSRIEGQVVQVRPARRLARNGLLRIQLQKVVPPDGIEQEVTASLDAVEVAKNEHLTLDSEGGAQVTTPRTRYFATALSVALAASSMSDDHDRDGALRGGGDGGNGALTGAAGFRLVGMLAGAMAHSRVLGRTFGFYGAGTSAYSHFLARGHEVVYPKDMTMLIGLGKGGHPQPAHDPQVKPASN